MTIHWPTASDAVVLSGEEVHVWGIAIEPQLAQQRNALALLSAEERERAERFARDEPRRRFVAARAALRQILGCYLQVAPQTLRLTSDTRGKPRLSDDAAMADVRFNVAHSGQVALVAVTLGAEVGVDVERLRPVRQLEQIARRYFSPVEASSILAVESVLRRDRFFRCWTSKEAILKASGTGLSYPLAMFTVPPDERVGTWVDLPAAGGVAESRCWLAPADPCPGYVGAVATLAAPGRAVWYRYRD